jgi:signal transduction histidine kinase
VSLALTVLVPLALIASTAARMVARVDRLLTHTVAIAGLTMLVLVIYIVVVLGLGRTPSGGERTLLLLSMLAAGIAALLYLPARRWLTERANRLVYGERVAPDETLRTFGQRLTRSIPLDELMLQLAENLRKSMVLESAEVWTGKDGRYERTAGVPHRQVAPITIGPKELPVIARAGVSGGTWLDIWLPQLVGPTGSSTMRVAPVAHAGLLLGFIVVSRKPDGEPFTETEDTVLTEIARQIGLALHNVQLDTALQASLDELRVRNQELQESRARIVAAGDAERRKLERNLHDGAQQHLVALAVKLRLAHDAVEDDPEDAMGMIDEIKADVQTAIAELRALAHGIFPPLLVSGGLSEALPAAASRAALPTSLDLDNVGRYGDDIEAAVYFCTLEALQNAGKHAGEAATATVHVSDVDGVLRFEISDDGAGFEMVAGATNHGHGFVNMADRLGAFGGNVKVVSAPGAGTTIIGTIPLPEPA